MGSSQILFDIQGSGITRSPEDTIRQGEWMHVIGTYENAQQVRIYIDGKLASSSTTTNPMPSGERVWTRIGQSILNDGGISRKSDNDRTGALQGSLDEFLYLPRVVSDEEAHQIYVQSGGNLP